MTRDPAKLEDAVALIDDYLGPDPVPAPPHISLAWKTVRAEVRRSRRTSSQAMPAVVGTAQRLAMIRDESKSVTSHAQRALDELGAVFGSPDGSSPSEPPPER